MVVVAGTVNRLKYLPRYSVVMPVKKIFVPDGFTAYNTHNIALIKLKRNLPMHNPHVGIIDLPEAEPEPGLNYTVLGWGRMLMVNLLPKSASQIIMTPSF